jgi:hypothetical protein
MIRVFLLILRSTILQAGLSSQIKAMLRELDCDEVIEIPIPKDVDAAGAPVPMNARERQDFNRELRALEIEVTERGL